MGLGQKMFGSEWAKNYILKKFLGPCLVWQGLPKIETFLKHIQVCKFGCRSCFCKLIYDFLAGNNYSNSPHWQGGMKLATQIPPLLN